MRYYYLDFARSAFLLLGVVYHAALIFSGGTWIINDSESSQVFFYFTRLVKEFRMEGFFIISGFFSMMVIEKMPLGKFLHSRMLRLGVPMLFFGFTFNTLLIYFFDDDLLLLRNWQLFDYVFYGYWLRHLWFLGDLLVMVFVAVAVLKFIPRLPHFIANAKIPYWSFLLFVGLATFVSRRIGWQIPDPPEGAAWFFVVKHHFFYYLPFFVSGFIFFLNPKLLSDFIKNKFLNLIIASLHVFLLFSNWGSSFQTYINELLPIGSMCMVGLNLYVFKLFFDKKNDTIFAVSEASYSIYLLHQPLLVWVAYYVIDFDLSIWSKFLIILLSVYFFSYYVHRLVIRKVPLFYFLFNGKR